jgi:hypothetical protein
VLTDMEKNGIYVEKSHLLNIKHQAEEDAE